MAVGPAGAVLNWPAFIEITHALAERVTVDGRADIIVGVLRGGMIPAVLLAHALGLRAVRAVEVTHTAADGADAAKIAQPAVHRPQTLGDLGGLDVLVVDDIAGTGDTMATTAALVRQAGARRVRTLACVVNEVNWRRARVDEPGEALTYIGAVIRGCGDLFFIEPDGSVWDCPSGLRITATHPTAHRTISGHTASELFAAAGGCNDCRLFSVDCVNMWPLMNFGAFLPPAGTTA